jgi:hypothetical protein
METLEAMILIEDKTITVNDARKLYRGCVPGWKVFAEQHSFDWKQVTRHGLKASQLLATNDAMAIAIVRSVYEQ